MPAFLFVKHDKLSTNNQDSRISMFGNDRNAIRQQFISTWEKYRLPGTNLTPFEQMIGQIIEQHPEYHQLFESHDAALLESEFSTGGTPNPFFHLGLHISLHEQLQTDRPSGIRHLYQLLTSKTRDSHTVEHRMMECLAKCLWEAQSKGCMPDEEEYLDCLRKLV